jgi:NADH-quinone oxidoreductase subunit N
VPDVYTGVPMVITLFFATVVKFIIFIVFFRATMYFNSNLLIDFFIISSLAVGSLLTLRQLEIKRFLAYSSITHVGFLLMGDLVASLVYIITYICASLLLFSVLLTTRLYKKELVYLSDLRAIKKSGY